MYCDVEVSRELDEELRKTRDLYHKLREEFNTIQDRLKFFDKVIVFLHLVRYKCKSFLII